MDSNLYRSRRSLKSAATLLIALETVAFARSTAGDGRSHWTTMESYLESSSCLGARDGRGPDPMA